MKKIHWPRLMSTAQKARETNNNLVLAPCQKTSISLDTEGLQLKQKKEEHNERSADKEQFICAFINVEKVVWLLIHCSSPTNLKYVSSFTFQPWPHASS